MIGWLIHRHTHENQYSGYLCSPHKVQRAREKGRGRVTERERVIERESKRERERERRVMYPTKGIGNKLSIQRFGRQ